MQQLIHGDHVGLVTTLQGYTTKVIEVLQQVLAALQEFQNNAQTQYNIISRDVYETMISHTLRQNQQMYYNTIILVLGNIQTSCKEHIATHTTKPPTNFFRDLKNLES